MAITISEGMGGSVTWDGDTQAYVTAWTINATVEIVDATTMASTDDWAETLAGVQDWTATVDIVVDSAALLIGIDAALGQMLASAALVLNDGVRTITGTGLVTNISITVPATDKVVTTYTVAGNSALT